MKVVDLFSGAGGMSCGAEKAGLEVIAAFDSWGPAIENYKNNFTHNVHRTDLGIVSLAAPTVAEYDPDIIVGGPPCQDFSHAGQRNEGERAELTKSFAEIIAFASPEAFVMENVPAALKSKTYSIARQIFKDNNYGLTEVVLDASYYEVPQRRKRLFVIGIKGGVDNEFEQTIRQIQSLFPLSVRRGVSGLEIEHYYRHPRSYERRGVFSIDEPSPTIRGVNRPRPVNYVPHPGDTSESVTVRSLTQMERAKIQTFDHAYKWSGSLTEIEQMTGNAVPPNLAKNVLGALKNYLSKSKCKSPEEQLVNRIVPTARDILATRKLEKSVPIAVGESLSDYTKRVTRTVVFQQESSKLQNRIDSTLSYYSGIARS